MKNWILRNFKEYKEYKEGIRWDVVLIFLAFTTLFSLSEWSLQGFFLGILFVFLITIFVFINAKFDISEQKKRKKI